MEINKIEEKIEELEYVVGEMYRKTETSILKKWSIGKYITISIISLFGISGGILLIYGESFVLGILILGTSVFYLVGGLSHQLLINKTIEKYNHRKENTTKRISELKKLKSELLDKQNENLLNSIREFKSELDSDNDNNIDIIQHDNEFKKILKSNQELILEYEKSENRDFTKQFVKLSNFLIEKEKSLQKIFSRIEEIKEKTYFDNFKPNLIEQIQFYNVLRLNSLQMISSFVEDDRITFYIIYERLDKLGIWNTNFENQFLSKIDLLNSNIDLLTFEIRDMSDLINHSINELISITEENTLLLSEKLKGIDSKLDLSNILNTINIYKNYKTNKSTKSLKE